MNPSAKPTIRLQNIAGGNTQLNLHLMRTRAKATPGLRRGLVMTPVRILPGRYFDVCAELAVDIDEARRIVASSPEVKAHVGAKRLMVREFPTTADQAAEDARTETLRQDAAIKTAALNPPDPPNAVPAGVDLEAAGLPEDTPRMTRPPSAEQPSAPAHTPAVEAPSEAAAVEDGADAGDADDDAGPDAGASAELAGEPSMDWTVEELKAYAEEHHVDVGQSTSKTAVLKKIRRALSS